MSNFVFITVFLFFFFYCPIAARRQAIHVSFEYIMQKQLIPVYTDALLRLCLVIPSQHFLRFSLFPCFSAFSLKCCTHTHSYGLELAVYSHLGDNQLGDKCWTTGWHVLVNWATKRSRGRGFDFWPFLFPRFSKQVVSLSTVCVICSGQSGHHSLRLVS